MKHTFKFLLIFLLILSLKSNAQTTEQSAWLASMNTFKLNDKLGIHFDLQFRSADDISYLRNLLVRPGLIYFINDKQNVTAGYAWIETFADPDVASATNLTEHRIWEQYILNYKIGRVPLTHRFRLEQRFIERASEDVFAQRLRYFVRGIIPLKADSSSFTKGPFLALQNELFFNLQNKEKLNGHTFDQNRALASVGYRLNKGLDLEAGYLNQYSKGAAVNNTNHVVQLAVYCRF